MNRLEYCKMILRKISFDRTLLEKEYCKALKLLEVNDGIMLTAWCKEEFRVYATGFQNTKTNN